MNIADLRETMGLTVSQVADELNVPRQDVIDCEETGVSYLLSRFVTVFPINPAVLTNPEADPFLDSFDQTSPGNRMRMWRNDFNIPLEIMAKAFGESPEFLQSFENGENNNITRSRGELIEKKTGMNRKWLMYGDGRIKGTPSELMLAGFKKKEENEKSPARTSGPNKEAGKRLKAARLAAGISREELAESLGLSVSRITQMESGYVKEKKIDEIIRGLPAGRPEEDDKKALGTMIREARINAGLTKEEAAELAGLRVSSLAHMESGYVSAKRMNELVELFGKSAKKDRSATAAEIGARIRDARKEAGMTQKELATILRVTPLAVTSMELGEISEKKAEEVIRKIKGEPRRVPNAVPKRIKKTDQIILGASIRDARTEVGFSQRDLAEKLGISQARISTMERGKVDQASYDEIMRLIETERLKNAPDSAAREE